MNLAWKNVSKNNLAVFNDFGDIKLSTEKNGSKFIVVGGKPLNESVARGGPFVMNTKSEIIQAINDYNNGTFVR